jgi:hypothetical protein
MAPKADGVLMAAEQALELAKAHNTKLEPRLPAGFFDLLRTDVATVRGSGDVLAVRATKKAATITQDEAVRQGFELVGALRATVRTGAPRNKVLWKAFGVGSTLSPTVRSVSAALGTVQAAATRFPSETAAVGLLADDMQRAQTLAAAIASADSVQEASKLTSKQATAQLNAAIARLTANLGHLASVARVALPANVAQSFSALVPSGSKKKPAPAPQ